MLPRNQPSPLKDAAEKAPASKQVRDAIEHFEKTGSYRPADLRKLLGDPAESVVAGPGAKPSWAK